MSSAAPFAIALDGPAASGKSTVGLSAARALGFGYFDTGLLYRALTWLALASAIAPTDESSLLRLVDQLDVDVDASGRVSRAGADITDSLHTPEVDAAISMVAAHPRVRQALVPIQRALVRGPGLVMAGRDIGTVILPDAPLKIWLSASAEERARRRAAQTGAAYADVLRGMRQRDRLDGSRATAPMARAADAVEITTDNQSVDATVERIVSLARERGARPITTASVSTTTSAGGIGQAHPA